MNSQIFRLGELLTINETHEPDLYWALRGAGGGLFVIVTELKLRLVRPPPLVRIFSSTWYTNATKPIIQRYQSLLFNDKTLNSNNNMFVAMQVKSAQVGISIDHFGTDVSDFNKIISSLLDGLPTPNITNERTQDWLSYVYERSSAGGAENNSSQLLLTNLTYPIYNFKAKHLYYNQPISDHSLDQLIDRLALLKGRITTQFNPWDGFSSTIPVDQTAFPHRHFKFGIQFTVVWDEGQDEKQQLEWLNEVYLAIYNDSTKFSYINYIDREVPNWMDVYYHTHQQRLIQIQHIYDKDNRFYFEKTIESNGIDQHLFLSCYLASFTTFLSFIV